MASEPYRHTQPGYLLLFALGLAIAAMLFLAFLTAFNLLPTLLAAFFAVLLALFWSLSVEIDDVELVVWFGPGLARRRLPLERIRSVRTVYNPWYYGWGIRWIPGVGWIYNVSGTAAIELRLDTGRRFRIGTDVPEEYARALETRGVPYTSS